MTIADAFHSMHYDPAPEGAKEAHAWLEARDRRLCSFIDGSFREPTGGRTFDTLNPATGGVLAQVAASPWEDVDAAVRAAAAAQPGWWALGGHGRARFLYALARGIQKRARLLAVLETLDNGKPIRETRDIDVPLAARHFSYHAGWAQLLSAEYPESRPLGVAAQVIPWNFPLLMLAWKIAPALATGNTVVLKPAEYTSITAVAFAELCADVGLPAGVVNICTGDGTTGAALVTHPGVQKVAFTGSTEVGRDIRAATAGTGKALTLELGGKSPFVVFDDADLDSAVEGVVDAIWFNQGEVCCAGSRLLVQEGVTEAFHDRLRRRMETLRIGDPLDKTIDIGAVVHPVQLARIQELVARGVAEGGRLWQPATPCPTEGCFYPPTLFTDVTPASTIVQEEIFGPVLVSMTFRTPAEAVALANDTRYGLAASVWTENVDLALDIAAQVQAGTVWVNCTNQFDAAAGFGGCRESGYGREGGREGLVSYLQPVWRLKAASPVPPPAPVPAPLRRRDPPPGGLDRTAKMYIGGRQVRPDGGQMRALLDSAGMVLGEVGEGNRKDIRNAVEAARSAASWARTSGHQRAQILYYIAENLSPRRAEFALRLAHLRGCTQAEGEAEVDQAIERLFLCAAWADKYDGQVHDTAPGRFTFAIHEAIGTIGILCPEEAPLLAFVSTVFAAVAMGNAVVVVPSERQALVATDFYQVLETSDVPAGVVNIVTGSRRLLGETLADHDDVDALWSFGDGEMAAEIERRSVGNLKRTWCEGAGSRNWADPAQGAGPAFLQQAVHVKNIWVPYGE